MDPQSSDFFALPVEDKSRHVYVRVGENYKGKETAKWRQANQWLRNFWLGDSFR